MADDRVKEAQRFINSYNVNGIPKVDVNGVTSWTVMYALTRILQFHLGITALSDAFGPATESRLQSDYPIIDKTCVNAGINRVIQSALWCKGYAGGDIDGVYDGDVKDAVIGLATDAGLTGDIADGRVRPKLFKALLTMDAYVKVSGGTNEIRTIQQWLNRNYLIRRDFYIIPCDGNFSRDVQKALLLAIQFQIGMADGVANGVFGPGTQAGLQDNPVRVGDTGTWVRLFSAALVFNRRSGATFTGSFTTATSAIVRDFQQFVQLPVNGVGNYKTWASLLISYGDNTRVGTAGDCATELTSSRLTALRSAGYTTIGRYLCNVPGSSLNKMIQPGELARCVTAGMRIFPIFQLVGSSSDAFNHSKGMSDALQAIDYARSHGFKSGTTIYFAVDYDALDDEVTTFVLPYFRAISETFSEFGRGYSIGVYGARNICTRVSEAGLATNSFISDMSSGFSGNLGYPHPVNWAFDQISQRGIGSGDAYIQIDNDISSGRDLGQIEFTPVPTPSDVDVAFDQSYRDGLLYELREYLRLYYGYGETGSPSHPCYFSTEESLAKVILKENDRLITDISRRLRMRKALTQAILFQEIRHAWEQDLATDAAVIDHYVHAGPPPRSPLKDCSTGLGQIYAATAIRSRNYCIRDGLIGGEIRSETDESDLWPIWQRLKFEDDYNIGTVPLVLIEAAHQASLNHPGVSQPSLDQDKSGAFYTLAYYNNGDSEYGTQVVGYWEIFEKYNRFMRSQI